MQPLIVRRYCCRDGELCTANNIHLAAPFFFKSGKVGLSFGPNGLKLSFKMSCGERLGMFVKNI
jgi:hypothetical protein